MRALGEPEAAQAKRGWELGLTGPELSRGKLAEFIL